MVTKCYSVALEISGPTAMWTRPDTGDVPVSYPAPTFSAVKAIFESIVWLKNAEVLPQRGGGLRSAGLPHILDQLRWTDAEGADHEDGE